jgi:hypothetical protein
MRTTKNIAESLILGSLIVFTFDTNSSQAAPSNWILESSQNYRHHKSRLIKSLARTRRSTNEESSTTTPVEPRIRDLPWYEEMERPCFQGETHLNPQNNFSWVMTDHLSDQQVLSISGEEAIARSYFSRVESRLSRLSQKRHFSGGVSFTTAPFPFLSHSQCPTEMLSTMPNVQSLTEIWRSATTANNSNTLVSHHQLETAYKTFLHLSVAFKFIAMDWSEFGHSCINQQADNVLHAEFNKISRRFRDNMCFLMKSRQGGKQPTSSMRSRLYADIKNTKVSAFHRQETCTNRQRRDCAAVRQSREIIGHFVSLLSSTPR